MTDFTPGSFEFCPDGENWVMKIENTGNGPVIKFNTDDYPDSLPNDFAKAVCEILCQQEVFLGWLKEKNLMNKEF